MMGEWNSVPLADLASFYSGGTPSKEKAIYWGGSTPWVTVKDMKSMRLNSVSKSLTEQGADTVRVVPAGTVLVLVRGMSLFKDLPVALCNQPVTFNQDIKGLVAKQNVDSEYLAFALIARKSDILRHVESSGHGTGRLDTDLLKSTPLPLPPLSEQRKIAEILRTWDRAIELTSALLAAARTRKRGLMQILLTGKCRFPEFAGQPWREVRVGEVGKVISGGTPDSNNPDYWDGGILWATPTDITSLTSRFITSTTRTISEAGLKASAARLVPEGAILICTRATIGELAIAVSSICTNQGFKNLVLSNHYDSDFIFYLLQFSRNTLVRYACGSTFLELSKKDFEKQIFKIPSLDEQKRIAAVLNVVEKEIDQHRQTCENLRIQKRGLMQKLLTGELRVPLDSTSIPMHTGG